MNALRAYFHEMMRWDIVFDSIYHEPKASISSVIPTLDFQNLDVTYNWPSQATDLRFYDKHSLVQ